MSESWVRQHIKRKSWVMQHSLPFTLALVKYMFFFCYRWASYLPLLPLETAPVPHKLPRAITWGGVIVQTTVKVLTGQLEHHRTLFPFSQRLNRVTEDLIKVSYRPLPKAQSTFNCALEKVNPDLFSSLNAGMHGLEIDKRFNKGVSNLVQSDKSHEKKLWLERKMGMPWLVSIW